jgi:sulfite reductase (NADPH) flavoprotein alpha-component
MAFPGRSTGPQKTQAGQHAQWNGAATVFKGCGNSMTRRIIFQIHWFLGITAGLVLAWMGVTGAIMSFREELLEVFTPALYAPGPPAGPDLSPDLLIARIAKANPGYYVSRLDLETDRDRTHGAMVMERGGAGWRMAQIDRATGAWLGDAPAAPAFNALADLHRWLTLPGGSNVIGRQVTGICALALVFFALSGLYLRWPRRVTNWRSWLALDMQKTGRNFWRALHAVTGTWVFLAYLTSAMTGLWWCYDWYQSGATYILTGKEIPSKAAPPAATIGGPAATVSLDRAWTSFQSETGGTYASVRIALPPPGQTVDSVTFQARPADARHLRQTDRYSFEPATGRMLGRDFYDRRPLRTVIAESVFELHRGSFFGLPGRIIIFLSSATMPLFTITGYLLYLARRRRKQVAANSFPDEEIEDGLPDLIIVYATQTGGAERMARDAAHAFRLGGRSPRLIPAAQLTPQLLASTETALFVVSTYGEGEPPDMARGFARRMMQTPVRLEHLRYGILARGDREYVDFCGFGAAIDQWLAKSGAQAIFEMIAMDSEDAAAADAWHQELEHLGAVDTGEQSRVWQEWRLASRVLLNPLSHHAKAFHLKLTPADGSDLEWLAGDIVEIQPQNSEVLVETFLKASGLPRPSPAMQLKLSRAMLPADGIVQSEEDLAALPELPLREYSAASIPADGTLDLVVRQVSGAKGQFGIGSGWLTAHMRVGDLLSLRLRPNPGFRVDDDAGSLILIGNGTGIAGLRAHIRAMERRGRGGHWLLFGERSRGSDAFFEEEISGWLANGILARVDRAFSRDPDCGRYVQDLVAGAGVEFAEWLNRGATLLVCGSLQGMAPAVHSAVASVIGEERLEELAELGRYKRDVY